MYGLAVCVKEGFSFARDLSLEYPVDSYVCFRLALLHSVSYFFFPYRSPSSSLSTVFDSVSSNVDEVLAITHLLMCLSLGTLTSITRTGSTILVELTDLVNSDTISPSQMTLLTRIPDCDSHRPAFLDLFLSSDVNICSTMAFSPLENSDHVVVSVSIDFP